MIDLVQTEIPGCFEVRPIVHRDARGTFVKWFVRERFREYGLEHEFVEHYHSLSEPRVLRGLHFQLPPSDHAKIVQCIRGAVFDVAVDLRRGSPAFGRPLTRELSAETNLALYLPRGIAHGFYVLSGPALVCYSVTSPHCPSRDAGVRWSTVAAPWPDAFPTVSERDGRFPALGEFETPFVFER